MTCPRLAMTGATRVSGDAEVPARCATRSRPVLAAEDLRQKVSVPARPESAAVRPHRWRIAASWLTAHRYQWNRRDDKPHTQHDHNATRNTQHEFPIISFAVAETFFGLMKIPLSHCHAHREPDFFPPPPRLRTRTIVRCLVYAHKTDSKLPLSYLQ